MPNRNLILYIAMSLDGYIAGPDDDLSFLSSVESPGEDYGYKEFTDTIDTVIMGRKTYEKVLSFGIGWPHRGKDCYIISKTRTGANEDVTFFNGEVEDLIADIRQKEGKDIYCDGGAELVFELMKKDLIDKYIISVIPALLGDGTKLFKDGRAIQSLVLTNSKVYPTGLVQLHYTPLSRA